MERLDPTLWKEPGTARGRIAIIAYRRCRYPCGHGSCRSWYRCSRRQSGHQLPDGKYHRGLRPSYRCVFLNLVFLTGPIDGVCPFCLGRTGRAGKQGIAITFLTNDDDEVMCVKFSLLRLLFVGKLFFSVSHFVTFSVFHLSILFLDIWMYILTSVFIRTGTISSKVRLMCFGQIPLARLLIVVLLAIEISKSPVSKVPIELAKHEAAQHKVSKEMKRKRDAEDQG